MFRRTTVIATATLLLFGILLTWSMAAVHSSDRNNYHQLVQTSAAKSQQHAPGLQHRRGVTKDLYLVDGANRLHSRLASPTSTVQFAFHSRDTEVEEIMDEVVGDIQDDLFYLLPDGNEVIQLADGTYHRREGRKIFPEPLPFDSSWQPAQEIRHISAEAARYQLNSGKFRGNRAFLDRFRAKGHTLAAADKQDHLMHGEADQVEFSAGNRKLDFRARHLHAIIYSPQGAL